ncbi:MAG: hypothetical protein AVDCRST_MAG85-1754 [uncultured Solirubrobacteraceae bacterium]|uniref:Uncharacterized protein n=1 Tax=uncultured Solirubrobacteraceae bacterium TaxID=1162706 RepID=A0A6J4SJT8_9ACTN|nr:MAG: hypothetical protein AVDCRST_MAG85-1754 [uncultured Solirubrobacteraceae bacterium]
MRRRAVEILVVGALLVLAGYAYWIVPFATERTPRLVSTPSPFARYAPEPVVVPADGRACLDRVGLSPRIGAAVVRLADPKSVEPVALEVELRARGYVARGETRGRPRTGGEIIVDVRGPREDALGVACIVNRAEDDVTLSATSDPRIQTRSQSSVNGNPVGPDVGLIFLEPKPESLASLAGVIADRVTVWKPGIVGPWLVWILLVVVAIGVPAGALWAYAQGDDDGRD